MSAPQRVISTRHINQNRAIRSSQPLPTIRRRHATWTNALCCPSTCCRSGFFRLNARRTPLQRNLARPRDLKNAKLGEHALHRKRLPASPVTASVMHRSAANVGHPIRQTFSSGQRMGPHQPTNIASMMAANQGDDALPTPPWQLWSLKYPWQGMHRALIISSMPAHQYIYDTHPTHRRRGPGRSRPAASPQSAPAPAAPGSSAAPAHALRE